ncbi:MAG: DUF1587 domain-containing protein, partial [Planctomycetes bacterium]|nr:DUF1587 domain-containing protein [Planctomycetota bacterium]
MSATRRFFVTMLCALAILFPWHRHSRAQDTAAVRAIERDFPAAIQPLLKRYCFECHSEDEAEADINLAAFRSIADVRKQTKVWLKVREMCDTRQMPPKDAKQPSEAERVRLQKWVRAFLASEAKAHAGDPGPVMLRRLSNAEYNYTVRDLTGVDSLDPTREFPIDGAAGEGFTNAGSGQGMSPALAHKYLDAAKQVAAHAVLLGGPQKTRRSILPAVVQGKLHLALARTQEGGRFDAMGGRFFADSTEGGYLLFGEKLAVPGLAEADHIVVAAVLGLPEKIDEGVAFFLIDPKVTGVVIEPLRTLDGGWTQASLRLDAVRVPADRLLGEIPGEGPGVNERVSAMLDLALAFDALGGAQRAMETAVEYAKVRTAFGQPIGSYQAIKHKCADML